MRGTGSVLVDSLFEIGQNAPAPIAAEASPAAASEPPPAAAALVFHNLGGAGVLFRRRRGPQSLWG